ncbi:MAG TPA: methyltransferase domain-containing protein [bacterium]|nr:methyltransferase domain-containing protein [bacterium]
MPCCCGQCAGIEAVFGERVARWELARYRRRGARGTTKLLLELLRAAGSPAGRTLLDIGGGIGAIQHELAAAGIAAITSVDASPAYLAVQRAEAERRGYAAQVRYLHGDFTALAPEVEPHDIVTLDRVICCYHDMPALVGASAARTRQLYGAVYPRRTWWTVAGVALINLALRLRGTPFRTFVHPPAEIERILAAAGLRPRAARRTVIWHVAVYTR